ncbi:UNVERIFIED_CONTAM: hypothetical protein Q9R58_23645, partial [Methylobacteriaceae bacterium AG10]|nr:hypothetical protein [Methylobacteriaceae bacterium AG10]
MNIAFKQAAHAAPGPYLGFSLQPVRLCYHLLTAPPGSQVSIEYLDDVAVHYRDGSLLLEQCKSATRHNPISDRAPSLWKTISHWLEECAHQRVIAQETRFQLYVVPERAGKLASMINAATSTEDVEAFDKKAQLLELKTAESAEYLPFLRQYLNADNALRTTVVSRIKIESCDQDPVAPLIALIEATVPSELAEMIARAAIGLAKEWADQLMRAGKPGIVDRDAFRKRFHAFVQRSNLPGLLISLSPKPDTLEIDALLAVRPTFVRQLEIIEVDTNETFRAVSDFLRTSADKAKWAETGLLYPGSLDEWDENLVRRHSSICGEISDLHAERTPLIRGRLAYRNCSRIEAALDGRAVPSHFVHGCLNALANDKR